jgi:hypothetical protein
MYKVCQGDKSGDTYASPVNINKSPSSLLLDGTEAGILIA